MAPRGASMVGMSRTARPNGLAGFEFLLVRERGDHLVHIAHPSGQQKTEFVSTTTSAGKIVFENPEHDFPQRIGYERAGTQLSAWIEGERNGETRRIDFPYHRAVCPGN